jgi:hypothetical protein
MSEPERTSPNLCVNEAPGPFGEGLHCRRLAGHDGQHFNGGLVWEHALPTTPGDAEEATGRE